MVAAWSAKQLWWNRLRSLVPLSTPESATGLGHIGRVRLFERPHVNDNYLTREMGFKVARKHALKLSKLALLAGGVLPVLLMIAAIAGGSRRRGGRGCRARGAFSMRSAWSSSAGCSSPRRATPS